MQKAFCFSLLNKKSLRVVLYLFFIFFSILPNLGYAQVTCPATPFRCDVERAINLGLQYTRSREVNGIIDDVKYNFLGFLSFLEKRAGLGLNSPTVGYDGMSDEDQALVRRLIREHINGYETHQTPTITPYNYVVGGGMMEPMAANAFGGGFSSW